MNSPHVTFTAAVAHGWARPDDINDWVDRWHAETSDMPLHEWLGLSVSQCNRWVDDPASLDMILTEILAIEAWSN